MKKQLIPLLACAVAWPALAKETPSHPVDARFHGHEDSQSIKRPLRNKTGEVPSKRAPQARLTNQTPLPETIAKQLRAPSSAKSLASAACTAGELSVLSGTALVDAVKGADVRNCLYGLYSVSGSLGHDLFQESKMVSVASAIAAIGSSYDGSNSAGLLNLVTYLRAGYYVQYGEPDVVGAYGSNLKTAIRSALDGVFASSHLLDVNDGNGEIVSELMITVDSADEHPRYLNVARRILNGMNKSWLDSYWPSNMAHQAVNTYYLAYQNHDDVNALLQTDPTLASDLLAFYNRYKDSILGGLNDDGDSTSWFIINVVGEYTRMLQYSAVRDSVKSNVQALLASLDKNNDEQFKVWIRIATITNDSYWTGGDSCSVYNTCGYEDTLRDRVLATKHTCADNDWLRFMVQEMSAQQLADSCTSVRGELDFFHATVGTSNSNPIPGDKNTSIEMAVFDDYDQYNEWAGSIFGISTNNGGMYLEGDAEANGNQARFIAHEASWLRPQFYIWNLSHEFVHYLDGRFIKKGNYGDGSGKQMVWWAEGLAEYIAYSYENKPNNEALSVMQQKQYKLSDIFKTPESPWDTNRVYRGGYMAHKFLFARHKEVIETIIPLLRAGNYQGYMNYLNTTLGTSLDAEFEAYWKGLIVLQPSTTLVNDVDVSVTVSKGQGKYYDITIPAGTTELKFQSAQSTGSGDLDLYVARDYQPTDSKYDQVSWSGPGANETVTLTNPAAGKYYVLARADNSTDVSNVTLKAKVTGAVVESETELQNAVGQTASAAQGNGKLFFINVPAGKARLLVETSGGSGDLDLYARIGAIAQIDQFDKQSIAVGNAELITFDAPAAGRYSIRAYGKSAYQNVTVKATIVEPVVNVAPIISAVTSNAASVFSGDAINVTATASDSDGDTLSYVWTVSPLLTLNNGDKATANATAPNVASDTVYTFTVNVSDGHGHSVQQALNVSVKPKANSAPTAEISVSKTSVVSAESFTASVTANDVDGDTLSYAWTANNGATVAAGSTPNVTITAPTVSADTVVTLTATISDGKGGQVIKTINVTVKKKVSSDDDSSGGGSLPAMMIVMLLGLMMKRRR